jgi:hypothetical protein
MSKGELPYTPWRAEGPNPNTNRWHVLGEGVDYIACCVPSETIARAIAELPELQAKLEQQRQNADSQKLHRDLSNERIEALEAQNRELLNDGSNIEYIEGNTTDLMEAEKKLEAAIERVEKDGKAD